MPLPDFLLIGATKCGTTSLERWLRAHPAVWMPEQKEVRYFTTQHNLHRGREWYAAQFAPAPRDALIGEASNAYTRYPVYDGVPERMAALLPDAKLLYLIRDPMKRIESHYRHRLVTGIEWRRPDDAITADPRYVAASLYGQQIEQYLRFFDRSQLLVVKSEDLFADAARALRKIAGFLGVDPDAGPEFIARNVTAARRVAPWPLRRLGGIARTKDTAKHWAALLSNSPARHLLRHADQPAFDLSQPVADKVRTELEKDQRLLSRFLENGGKYEVSEARRKEPAHEL